MKKWNIMLSSALVGVAFSAQAALVTNVDFTATGTAGWTVSGVAWPAVAGGVMAPPAGNSKLIYNTALAASNTTFSISTVFSFDSTGALLTASKDILAVGIGVKTNIHAQSAWVFLRRDASGPQYRLLIVGRDGANYGAATQFELPALSSSALCGIATNGAYSTDDIWLGMTMTRGAGTTWAISATISNMVTGWSMTRDSAFTSSTEFFTQDLGAYLYDLSSDTDGVVANRVVSSAVITAIPEPATIGLFLISGAGCIILRRRFFQ